MSDSDCIALLQWALPRLRLRWTGFRKVRRQVCRRIGRRLRELGLKDARAYRAHLELHPHEWDALDACCRITISRFWRDRSVFAALADEVLPQLAAAARARGEKDLRCWSAGCGSGEEPYGLRIAWQMQAAARFPEVGLCVTATDADAGLIGRARDGRFAKSSLREVPTAWIEEAFERERELFRIRRAFHEGIDFQVQDVRSAAPDGPFSLVLCRNLVFTYFEAPLQAELLARMAARLTTGGALVVGIHEKLPSVAPGFAPWRGLRGIHRRVAE